MWQRFTERARKVILFTQEEAERLGHRQVDTEHLLLGIFRENENARITAQDGTVWPPVPTVGHEKDSMAMRILRDMGVDLDALKIQTEQQALCRSDVTNQKRDLSAASKRVIDISYDEARQFKNKYIGTEHLLLGLLREGEGLAGRLFAERGISLEQTRLAVSQLQSGNADQAQITSLKKPWWVSLFGSNPKF